MGLRHQLDVHSFCRTRNKFEFLPECFIFFSAGFGCKVSRIAFRLIKAVLFWLPAVVTNRGKWKPRLQLIKWSNSEGKENEELIDWNGELMPITVCLSSKLKTRIVFNQSYKTQWQTKIRTKPLSTKKLH